MDLTVQYIHVHVFEEKIRHLFYVSIRFLPLLSRHETSLVRVLFCGVPFGGTGSDRRGTTSGSK